MKRHPHNYDEWTTVIKQINQLSDCTAFFVCLIKLRSWSQTVSSVLVLWAFFKINYAKIIIELSIFTTIWYIHWFIYGKKILVWYYYLWNEMRSWWVSILFVLHDSQIRVQIHFTSKYSVLRFRNSAIPSQTLTQLYSQVKPAFIINLMVIHVNVFIIFILIINMSNIYVTEYI